MTKSTLFFFQAIGLFFLADMLIPFHATAQEEPKRKQEHFTVDFGGGLGLFLPARSKADDASSSFADNSFVQLNYKKNVFVRLQSFKYTNKFEIPSYDEGIKTDFDVKVHTRNVGLNVGFQLDMRDIQPYAYVGGGLAFLDIPTSSYDPTNNSMLYRQKTDRYSFVSWGLGVNFKESESLSFFAEATGLYIHNLPAAVRNNFNGTVLSVGIKTPLSKK
ncbi:outer membrane beta-barrel protein [Sphingobacterium griseoflavum]|uniref:Outer membrane protein beta-barrel domain-containing protein n=1 Tax=Sphingobacterium griseoflavum TaxID=1474952 RepID=A0ABQ3I1M0_9SPHI|nr:outer membrane beta-barrel protein [Sphingobacterium griseoflavum]GHE45456.1 hypothetical protein GCM10017764_30830 [Sphingobacterium griseoflavum]